MNNPIISVKNLSVEYVTGIKSVQAVHNVSFEINSGEIFGLVGESGSGKSTVVQAMMRILPPPALISKGNVFINNEDIMAASKTDIINFRWKKVSIVMQSALNALNPVLSVREQIHDVLKIHKGLMGSEAGNRAKELLSLVDIEHNRLDSFPHQLSGGMKQRIVIAIALAIMPPIIIMDEPTTALDVIVEREIISKVIELRKKLGFTILFITHDLNLLLEFADRLAIMKDGEIVELDEVKNIQKGGKHPYTNKLIGSIPSASGDRQKGLLTKPDKLTFPKDPILEVRDLKKMFQSPGLFNKDKLLAVDKVSFKVFKGEIVGLVGESGSGKSTIAKLVTRLIRPSAGSIYLHGKNKKVTESRNVPLEYRKTVQMVFQDPYTSLNPVNTIKDILQEPMVTHRIVPQNLLGERVNAMLKQVGLIEEVKDRYPHELSGGQRQRVCIARALVMNPKLIIFDESVSALDVSVKADILNLLNELKTKLNLTYIFISHDLAVIRFISDRVLVMKESQKVEMGFTESIFSNPKEKYTQNLLSSIP